MYRLTNIQINKSIYLEVYRDKSLIYFTSLNFINDVDLRKRENKIGLQLFKAINILTCIQ